MEKVRRVSHRIVSALKEIPKDIELEVGVEIELLPKPIVKFFAAVHKYKALMKCKRKKRKNASRKKSNKRLQNNDESRIKRGSA
jgi:hypothetical protein